VAFNGKGDAMKQLEKMMILACALMIANLVVQLGWRAFSSMLENMTEVDPDTLLHTKILVIGILKLLVPLVIATWLYREAKRDGAYPWIWVLLALVFQFLAPILYYALKIHRRLVVEPSVENSAT